MVSMDNFNGASTAFTIEGKDKYVHFIFYFVFTFFWFLFFKKRGDIKKPLITAFTLAVVYGIIIEICQGIFTTERSADFFDALANTLGAATAVILLKLFSRKK